MAVAFRLADIIQSRRACLSSPRGSSCLLLAAVPRLGCSVTRAALSALFTLVTDGEQRARNTRKVNTRICDFAERFSTCSHVFFFFVRFYFPRDFRKSVLVFSIQPRNDNTESYTGRRGEGKDINESCEMLRVHVTVGTFYPRTFPFPQSSRPLAASLSDTRASVTV